MAIDNSAGVIITVNSLVAGVICQNVLHYVFPENEQKSPSDVYDVFVDILNNEWAECLADNAQISSVKIETTAPTGYTPYPPFTVPIAIAGTSGGVEPSTSFVAGRIYKIPNVATSEPSEPLNGWRAGMMRLAGIPESLVNYNQLAPTLVANMQLLGDELWQFTVDSQTLTLYQKRVISGTPYYVLMSGMYASATPGSQVSRKFNP